MSKTLQVKDSTIRLLKDDITDIEVDTFVFYARTDLALGSGYGTAITLRGGPGVQEELDKIGGIQPTEAVVTSAGHMKANRILHAAGPAFQEPDIEDKLLQTIRNALSKADAEGITQIAFPAMGAGFYGIPLDTSAKITLETIKNYMSNGTSIKEVIVCLLDNREYLPFEKQFDAMGQE